MKGKIKIVYDKDENAIEIIADDDGLNYLSDICMKIKGHETPAGHFHLMEEMKNLTKGSIRTTITYSPNPERE